MSIMIYVSGEGAIYGNPDIEKLKVIKNAWGFPAFNFSETGSGFEFSETSMEGTEPYEDGILKPLNSLIEYAKKAGFTVDAEFAITSDWSDYDNIEVIIEDNVLSTANSEVVNASTEELEAELKKRNKLEFQIKDSEEIIASRDENNYVEGYVQVHISTLIDNDLEGFLDIISEELIGSDLLMDINYEVVGVEEGNELIIKVRGDVSAVLETEEEGE